MAQKNDGADGPFVRRIEPKALGAVRRSARFEATATATERAAIAKALGLSRVEALSYDAELIRDDGADWRLEGRLRAKLAQPCSVTLEPVPEKIDAPFTRLWSNSAIVGGTGAPASRFEDEDLEDVADMLDLDAPEIEPAPDPIDLGVVAIETLVLSLEPYPRAKGAAFDGVAAAPPGAAPLTEESVRPFAGLSSLKDRMAAASPPKTDTGDPES